MLTSTYDPKIRNQPPEIHIPPSNPLALPDLCRHFALLEVLRLFDSAVDLPEADSPHFVPGTADVIRVERFWKPLTPGSTSLGAGRASPYPDRIRSLHQDHSVEQ
jgi:hypothetical protein